MKDVLHKLTFNIKSNTQGTQEDNKNKLNLNIQNREQAHCAKLDLDKITHHVEENIATNLPIEVEEIKIERIFQTLFSKKSGNTAPKKKPIGLSYEEIICFQEFISSFYQFIEEEVKNTKTAGMWDLINAFFRPTKSEIGIIIQNGFLRNIPFLTALNLLFVAGVETLAVKTLNKENDQEILPTYLATGTISASLGIMFAGIFKQIQIQNGCLRNHVKDLDKLIEKDTEGNIKFKNHNILDGANRITGSYNLITIFENLKNSIEHEINDFIDNNKTNNVLDKIDDLEKVIGINQLRASELLKKKSKFGLKQDQQSGILYNPNLSNSR